MARVFDNQDKSEALQIILLNGCFPEIKISEEKTKHLKKNKKKNTALNKNNKIGGKNVLKTIDERIMKLAIRLNPGADSLLPIANSYEKNPSKAHLDMFKDAIMPLR